MAYEEKTDWLPDDPINEDDVNRWEKGINDAHTDLAAHKNDMNNPHKTTKAQIGLGNVDNVQQAAKKDFDQHNQDLDRHVTKEERQKWNNGQLTKLTDDSGKYLISIQDGLDFHQIVDQLNQSFFFYTNNTGVHTPPLSTRGLYIGFKSYGEALAMDYEGGTWRKTLKASGWSDWVQLETSEGAQKKVDAHTNQTDIHVTKAEKDTWNAGQLFKITADNGTQKINLTSGSFYDSLKDVGSVTFYGTNAVTDNPSNTSLRGMQLVGQPGIGNGYAVDVKGNAWWFYYNTNQTSINWYPIESIAGAQSKVDAHAIDSSIHISPIERDKWNGGQLAKLTKDDGKRTRLESGSDILELGSGFYYGMGAQLKNNPVENDNSLFNYDVIESESGRKSILAWRSYDNNVWIATVHTDGVFKGWKRLFTEEEFNKMTWYDLTLINGHKAGARNPQYAVWGNQVFTRGEVVPPDFDSVFAVLPSEAHPSTQKSMAAPLFGTTGITKYYAEPTGELRINGKYAKIEGNITGISIDNNFTL
ncbi:MULTISPECIES: hypothetical protein [Bacillus amyloliquefaciens group]|uniref:hypothetical protein n=1 Tax=Bacillus amyloliquefaciens group TaxID=1938374 RepID=UPI000CA16A03|nr:MULTISPECIES: hypothetical protein [Bacillus amyloliquefaciens group]ATX83821.1 hypothetical protein CU084_07050 [Bacillus velezensis]QOH65958.1 hypothetical protein DKG78_07195 [Bacillus amyloliquefaciens]